MSDPERIWLQNANDARATGDRLWCQDKVWPECDEQQEPTEYIRADLYASRISQQDAELERLKVDASNHAADAETVRRERDALQAELERLRREVEEARKDVETAHAMGRQLIAEARKATFTEAATFAKNWLEDWGSELQGTCDAYREAVSLGKFSGRKISPDQAKTYARQFSERSDAVYACGELLAKDLRAKAEETKP